MKKFSYIAASTVAAVLPFSAYGAATPINNVDDIFTFIQHILNIVLPLIIALAVVYFVWGMFQLFLASDEEKKEKAKNTVIYGVIAIFVMVSVWGLVNILVGTFGLKNTAPSGIDANTVLPQVTP